MWILSFCQDTMANTMESGDFQLLETMRAQAGRIQRLTRHLERMRASAGHFGFEFDSPGIRRTLVGAARLHAKPVVLRLVLHRDGSAKVEPRPLPPAGEIQRLRRAPRPVDSADPFLYHKTTRRQAYDAARAGLAAGEDALLYNERGEITEGTIANIAVERGGRWITPPVSCGLLAGVMRAELLAEGKLTEGIIRLDELVPGERILYFNAVRGLAEVPYAL
jgi:para-aminobenzoate synthetase/4-amino-4-deoxychorismate lyase